jgi:NAD(P)-dependent dehydrogenase (short-subunit alcohol dehydrogenase family)
MVTGAAGNLGRAVAAAFAHEDANLVPVDLNCDDRERAFGSEDQMRWFAPTNLLDAAPVRSSVDATLVLSPNHPRRSAAKRGCPDRTLTFAGRNGV